MPRYIDADEIYYHKNCGGCNGINCESCDDYVARKSDINDIDTADVQEVVRCKDCIHRDPEDKKCDGVFCAKNGLFPMDDNDYCSYGERR